MAANLSSRRARGALMVLLVAAACGDAEGRQPGGAESAAAAGTQAESAADQARVTVRGVTGSYDLGDYFITGEVVNGLDVPIYGVELEVVYRGAGGRELAREDAAAVLVRVEPGGTAPFADTRYAAPEGITAREVRVTKFSRQGLDYRPLAISGVQSRAGITGAVVTGQARNDAGVPLNSIKLVTSFRNAGGEVTGVFFDYPVTGTLAPGQTVDFTVETMDDAVAGDRVTVQGEGQARQ